MIIGITGGSGSGKSYLSEKLAQHFDAMHIDIDKISHAVLSLDETTLFLKETFGKGIFDNGKVNRKKLGAIVFNDKDKLKLLNEFCQNEMEKIIDEELENTKKIVILDYALLVGLKQFSRCDIKILIDADFETRFERVNKRDNISRDYFLSRDKNLIKINKLDFDITIKDTDEDSIKKIISYIESKI